MRASNEYVIALILYSSTILLEFIVPIISYLIKGDAGFSLGLGCIMGGVSLALIPFVVILVPIFRVHSSQSLIKDNPCTVVKLRLVK